jgi:aryl-alcohol dehydrogenase-like predicted oxidoreductase
MTHSTRNISRRDAALLCGGALLSPAFVETALAQAQKPMLARPIPHGKGETIPAVGVGTSIVFNVGPQELAGPTGVIRAMVDGGGTLIDTAPSYGMAEGVVGDVLAQTGLRGKVFIATKLEDFIPSQEEAETQGCLKALRTSKIDLLQLHNVRDPNQRMAGIDALKARGICRYTGITTTFKSAYTATEAIIKREKPDFLLVDYAIDNRDVEARILPACQDAGTAVLVALPFGRGRLFRTALGKQLPPWAAEFDCASWGQFFLKFLLAHPAIHAVAPGTSKAQHMIDNLGAGRGRLPDMKMRERMAQYVEAF